MSPRVLVLTGGDHPFVDPWHPFRAVSERVAAIASEAGFEVEISGDPAARLSELDGVDVLVVNAPNATEAVPPAVMAAARAGLEAFLARPVGVLAVHVGTTTLLGLPAWPGVIGSRWVPGVTFHPPLGPATVRGRDDPRVPAPRIELVDERYTALEVARDLVTLVDHEHEGLRHPLVWAREVGPVRVVADTLGHDGRSFESPEHRELVARCLGWLVRRPA